MLPLFLRTVLKMQNKLLTLPSPTKMFCTSLMLINLGILSLLATVPLHSAKAGVDDHFYAENMLVVYISGDVYDLLSSQKVYFDYNGDGFKTERNWPNTTNGVLVLDLNGNGLIDNGGELFGKKTKIGDTFAPSAFAALRQHDFNKDGLINSRDPAYKTLRVWFDLNQDGVSQPLELSTLKRLDIISLNLKEEAGSIKYGRGNEQLATAPLRLSGSAFRSANAAFENKERTFNLIDMAFSVNTLKRIDTKPLPKLRSATPTARPAAIVSNGIGVEDINEKNEVAKIIGAIEVELAEKVSIKAPEPTAIKTVDIDPAQLEFLSSKLQQLPKVAGIGRLRDFGISAIENPSLIPLMEKLVEKLVKTKTLDKLEKEKIKKLDAFIEAWADMSSFPSLQEQIAIQNAEGIESTLEYSMVDIPPDSEQYQLFLKQIRIIERVVGYSYSGPIGQTTSEIIPKVKKDYLVRINSDLLSELQNLYLFIKKGVLESIELQTKFRTFSEAFETDLNKESVSFSTIESVIAQHTIGFSPQSFIDITEFILYSLGYTTDNHWDALGVLNKEFAFKRDFLKPYFSRLSEWALYIASFKDRTVVGSEVQPNFIVSTSESDTVYGGPFKDIFIARHGNDIIYGNNPNNDTCNSSLDGSDDDIFYGGEGVDTLYGMSGNDILIGEKGGDLLDGGCANDIIYGNAGDDLLSGGTGNDRLYGGTGNDRLDGGAGNDYLVGNEGSDTYLFGRGSGVDRVINWHKNTEDFDTIEIAPTLSLAESKITKVANDLVITFSESNDKLIVDNFFKDGDPDGGDGDNPRPYAVKKINFLYDKTPLTYEKILVIARGNELIKRRQEIERFRIKKEREETLYAQDREAKKRTREQALLEEARLLTKAKEKVVNESLLPLDESDERSKELESIGKADESKPIVVDLKVKEVK